MYNRAKGVVVLSKGILHFIIRNTVLSVSLFLSVSCLLFSSQSLAAANDILRPAVDPAKLPHKILFLIDTSASMRCSVGQVFDHHACNPPGSFDSGTGQYKRGQLKNRKMDVVREALSKFLAPGFTDGSIEVGLAVYSAPGAAILQPVKPLNHVTASSKTHREELLNVINQLVENGAKSTIGALLETATYLQGSPLITGGAKSWGGTASSWNPFGMEPFAAQSYSQAQSNMLSGAGALAPSTARLIHDNSQCAAARNKNPYLGALDSSCINLEWDQALVPTYIAPFRSDLICPVGSPGDGVRELVHVVLITDLQRWEDDLSTRVGNSTLAEYIDRLPGAAMQSASAKGAATSSGCASAMSATSGISPPVTETCFSHVIHAIESTGAQFGVWLVSDKPDISNLDASGLFYKNQIHPKVSASADEADRYFIQLLESESAFFPMQRVSDAPFVSAPVYGHGGEAFVSVTQPAMDGFWYGNLKKFVQDSAGNLVDSRGQSIWQSCLSGSLGCYNENAVDSWSIQGVSSGASVSAGSGVLSGGAVERQTSYGLRSIWLQNEVGEFERLRDLSVTRNWNSLDMMQKTAALSLARTFDVSVLMSGLARSVPLQQGVLPYLGWLQGQDASRFKLGTERDRMPVPPISHLGSRQYWGLSFQAQPVLVNYGFSQSSGYDDVLFVAGNDGFVRALSAETGVEYFSLMPRQLLNSVPDYYRLSGKKSSRGLHGEIAVWRQDQVVNGEPDGVIKKSEGDFVRLYLSGGASARVLFGVDATDRSHPKMLFDIDANTVDAASNGKPYKNMGHLRAKPILIKTILPGENSPSPLMVFGGGLDSNYWEAESVDCDGIAVVCGNQVYWLNPGGVRSVSHAGELIAWVSNDSNATLSVPNMRHSFASELVPIDTNSDGLTDFVYGVDVEGQVWRFTINHGQRADFIVPKVLAQLGQAGNAGLPSTEHRLYFQGLDAGVMHDPDTGESYVAIALGSGDVFEPFNTHHRNRLFLIKDRESFSGVALSRPSKLTDSETVEINGTSRNAAFAQRVRDAALLTFDLANLGEKMLVKPALIAGNVLFSTYTPPGALGMSRSENACTVPEGVEKLYGFSVFSGSSAFSSAGMLNSATALGAGQGTLQGGVQGTTGFLYPANLPSGSSLQSIKARLMPGSSEIALQLGGLSINGLGLGERFRVYSWQQKAIRP